MNYLVVRSLSRKTRIRWVAVASFASWDDANEYRLMRQSIDVDRCPYAIVVIPR